MSDYMGDFMEAKYHLAVAERMFKTYEEFPEKRILVGVINEGAKAAGKLVRAFLIKDGVRGGIEEFLGKVAPKYLDSVNTENLMKMLEVEKTQKVSRVEFARGEKIIFLINGEYRVVTVSRLREFVESISSVMSIFATTIKR